MVDTNIFTSSPMTHWHIYYDTHYNDCIEAMIHVNSNDEKMCIGHWTVGPD